MVTRQYLLGELLLRLERLQAAAECTSSAAQIVALFRQAECMQPERLGPLVSRAVRIANTLCWDSLARGDAASFTRQARAAADLFEFGVCSGLLEQDGADQPITPWTSSSDRRDEHDNGAAIE